MTYAKWEKNVRLLNDKIKIFTTLNEKGAVVSAFTESGEIWVLT